MAGNKESRAQRVAAHVHRAAEELHAAAEEVPSCDCAVLDEQQMGRVVADLARAELAAQLLHNGLRHLQRKRDGRPNGLATLETQPLDGIPSTPVEPRAMAKINELAEFAASESTGGQC